MKKYLCLTAAIIMSIFALVGCQSNDTTTQTPTTEATTTEAAPPDTTTIDDSKPHVEITIKDYGTIKVQLEPEYAPITVENFTNLVNDGFYDGLTFHRIISGFMIQGGDPEGTGMGGSDKTITGEFTNNNVENPLKHTRGALSMARSKDNNSASSQFFIVHQDSPHLNGDYAAFGYVIEGMDIVDEICEDTAVQDDEGTVLAKDQPIITSIKMVD